MPRSHSRVARLVDRTALALGKSDAPALVVAGGVAANQAIRSALADLAQRERRAFSVPPAWLCTDNAAMIACAGFHRLAAGQQTSLEVGADPGLALDEGQSLSGAGRSSGTMGAVAAKPKSAGTASKKAPGRGFDF